MNFKITGTFNEKISAINEEGELLFYSISNLISFDKRRIRVYDRDDFLMITTDDKTNSIKFTSDSDGCNLNTSQFEKRKGLSFKGFIDIEKENKINFKYNKIIFFNPYIKIFIEDKFIGYVKKSFFVFKKEYKIFIKDEFQVFINYILIYLLIFENVYDHE
ncbi:hypothetical protein [Aquimarina rhabdastrellae]